MAFQATVNRNNTYGIQGDLANGQVPHYYPLTPCVAASDSINAGAFAWVSVSGETVSAASHAAGAPTGIVQRVMDEDNTNMMSDASMAYGAGHKVDVITWGDVFVKTTDSATVGNVLFANNTTGAITNAAAGTSVSGATETKWKIVSLAGNAASASGSVVIVSNI